VYKYNDNYFGIKCVALCVYFLEIHNKKCFKYSCTLFVFCFRLYYCTLYNIEMRICSLFASKYQNISPYYLEFLKLVLFSVTFCYNQILTVSLLQLLERMLQNLNETFSLSLCLSFCALNSTCLCIYGLVQRI